MFANANQSQRGYSGRMRAFNFAMTTFAYQRLAQGLSRALSAFSSFMHGYLDEVIKAGQCAQYFDDIGIAANDAEHESKISEWRSNASRRCTRTILKQRRLIF